MAASHAVLMLAPPASKATVPVAGAAAPVAVRVAVRVTVGGSGYVSGAVVVGALARLVVVGASTLKALLSSCRPPFVARSW